MHTKQISGFRAQGWGTKIIFLLALFLTTAASNAQCAMCRAALEGEGNTKKAEAVNDGIVYLMAIPYVLVAIIFFYIYKTQIGKKKS
ncbi:DUF4134 domain-containing protein [Flavobacterium longum]|uniref:hypothetical protein n=1 Tax=Flavobacterium longum TaxID=1299340 RepID=UPI0039E902F3